jgi:hypothetical protein
MAKVTPGKTLGTAPRRGFFFETIGECLHEYLRYLESYRDDLKAYSVNLAHPYRSICRESTCY